MEKLFERMKEERLNHAVIKNWYSEFKANIEKCRIAYSLDEEYYGLTDYNKANENYDHLFGALWGLVTVGYISMELFDKYVDELITAFDFS